MLIKSIRNKEIKSKDRQHRLRNRITQSYARFCYPFDFSVFEMGRANVCVHVHVRVRVRMCLMFSSCRLIWLAF